MMSTEKLLVKERLEEILPDWNINEDFEAVSKVSHYCIDIIQMNQVFSLGLVVSEIYRSGDTLVIQFHSIGGNL